MAVHGPSTSHSHLSTTPLSSLGRVATPEEPLLPSTMLVWFATLASKKEIEARLDALEATVAAQNATIAALRDAIS